MALLLLPRWISVFTESINWDEMTMFERADRSAREGRVIGGSRPGMVTLLLRPLLDDCTDLITVALQARLLWQAITLAFLGGLFVLVRRWFRFAGRRESGILEGATAAALLAFLPAFVIWSVQVRSDQAALAAAIWGGVCLLQSTHRWAFGAGVLFGAALLCTQKGVYSIALCGLLWTAGTASRVINTPRHERRAELLARAKQVVFVVASMLATLGTYALVVPEATHLAGSHAVESGWQEMQRVRALLGYKAYLAEIPRAPVHLVLLLALLGSTVRAVVSRRFDDVLLLSTSWLVLLLGAAVVLVHGSSYPYFLMTAGLFPAVALGLTAGHFANLAGRLKNAVVAVGLAAVVATSLPATLELMDGAQSNQSDMIRWIRNGGLGSRPGFQVDGALICLANRDQLPPMSHQLNARGGLSPAESAELVREFRRRQIAYVIEPDRLRQFPSDIRSFWARHYRWYHGAVWIAGFELDGSTTHSLVDVVAPGAYVWKPSLANGGASLRINGQVVPDGGTVLLGIGAQTLQVEPADASGLLMLKVAPPSMPAVYPFVDPRQLRRLYVRN